LNHFWWVWFVFFGRFKKYKLYCRVHLNSNFFFSILETKVFDSRDLFFEIASTISKNSVVDSIWDQTWHFLTLANHPYFLICLFYFILDKNCILSFWNFYPLFLWVLKCSKKNLRKWTWEQVKMTKIFVFQPILNYFTILKSLKKCLFKKLIDKLFHRFFVSFSSIFLVRVRKAC
jgi:hypothetical protein